MQCFDCAAESSRQTAACATCHTCGAGLCLEHAVAGTAQPEVHGLGNPGNRPGRRVYCRSCAPVSLRTGDALAVG
ncbi:MAG: DUF2180 family protein [Propionicimonas sp.]